MAKKKKSELDVLAKRLKDIKAKDIMTTDVITTTEDATLADVAEAMIKARISGMPVIDKKGNVEGIISATDLFVVMDMIQSGDVVQNGMVGTYNPTVKFAMSTDIVSVERNTTLHNIIATMKYKNVHTLPVFEGKKMVGVVGRRDIFKNFYAVVKDLR
jgi:CBS domain-containing protein